MIKRFVAWITTHALALAVGFVLGGLFGVTVYANFPIVGAKARIERAEKKAEGFRADLMTCQGNTDRLLSAVRSQNAAVERLKAEAEERKRKAEAALAEARRETDQANLRVGRVLAAKPGADQCASADELILRSLR